MKRPFCGVELDIKILKCLVCTPAHINRSAMIIIEPRHEISLNNVVCATSKGSDQPAHTRRLIRAFVSRIDILLAGQHLEFLSLKDGCTGSSESIHVKEISCRGSYYYSKYRCTAFGLIFDNEFGMLFCAKSTFSRI